MDNRRSHYRFLASCLVGQVGLVGRTPSSAADPLVGQVGQAFPPAIADWHSLFALAAYEAVLPALSLRLPETIPSDVADGLAAVTELNRERNQHLIKQAQHVIGLLNDAGIEPVALKGLAYLLSGIYPDPAARYLCDIDFLIPESQLPAAIDALAQAGYTPDTSDALARFRHHAPQMQRAGNAPVELHHSLGLGLAAKILPAAEVFAGSTPLNWGPVHLLMPSPEHLVTHLILHSQIRHAYRERIWPPLRAMYDLLLLNTHFSTSLNWLSVKERFRSRQQHTTFALHLLQVERTLDMPRPLPIRLGLVAKFRWMRRCLLNRHPLLRFFDPVYLAFSTLSRRLLLLQAIFSVRGGWKYALRMLLRPGFYSRILDEVTLTSPPP